MAESTSAPTLTEILDVKHLGTPLDRQVVHGLATLVCAYACEGLAVVADGEGEDWAEVSAVVLDKLNPDWLLLPEFEVSIE